MRALLAVLLLLGLTAAPAAAQEQRFPDGFLWGTATAGFQVEAGGSPSNADRHSDWWRFTTDPGLIREGVVSGDRVDRGPGFWRAWRRDLALADGLGLNAIRLGIEWSRIFPRSTASIRTGATVDKRELRRLARRADPRAVRRYRAILREARRRGLRVMLTLNHFTLPVWVHDPLAVRRAFAAHRFGDLADLWATINEPLVTVSQGYVSIPGVTGVKAPAILNYPAALEATEHLGLANAAAYDAIKARRPRARVGFAHNMVAWRPADPTRPEDVEATRHADHIFNRAWLDIAVRGVYDLDVDGVEDPGERRPALANKADFVGVNHYSPGRVTALGAPVSQTVPQFDFVPAVTYRGHGNPDGPACPTTCTDFGWEIDPGGLRAVVDEAAEYGLPIYVTENGIDDREDDQRPAYLRGYLGALHGAVTGGADVRGYFHWSLVDNFEWAEGFEADFGLHAYDPRTLRRTRRPSASVLEAIARHNALP